ncbi:MAG: hypothetical protein Q8L66_15120 [Caulobacter sp.]|nr:hypothetical protein [Caulobacter sp.]
MKKTALILAGALAFDLGVLVVGAQAADAPRRPTATPGEPGVSLNFAKVEIDYFYIKIDAVTSRQACEHKSGKVVDVKGLPMCQVPTSDSARWTPVVPKAR